MERLGGVDVDPLLVVVPPVLIESVPAAVDELVGVTIVVPVLLAPDPGALGEASLGGAPVVPLALVPSVPDAFVVLPLDLGDLGAGLADLVVPLVVLDKLHALVLCGEDLGIFPGNLLLVLESGVVRLFLLLGEFDHGLFVKALIVLAQLFHFLFGGCGGHHLWHHL